MTANDLAPGTYRVHAGSADHSMFGNLLLSIEAPTARAAVEAQALDIIAASRGYDRARLLAVGIDLVREAPANEAPSLDAIEREAQALRVPMSHVPTNAEYLPVLAYRIEQEARAAQRRIDRLQALAAQVAAVEQEAPRGIWRLRSMPMRSRVSILRRGTLRLAPIRASMIRQPSRRLAPHTIRAQVFLPSCARSVPMRIRCA